MCGQEARLQIVEEPESLFQTLVQRGEVLHTFQECCNVAEEPMQS